MLFVVVLSVILVGGLLDTVIVVAFCPKSQLMNICLNVEKCQDLPAGLRNSNVLMVVPHTTTALLQWLINRLVALF